MTPEQIKAHIDENRKNGYYDASWTDDAIVQNLRANGHLSDGDLSTYKTSTIGGGTLGGLVTPTVSSTTPTASVTTVPNSNYNQVQNANQTGSFGTVGTTNVNTDQTQKTDQTSTGTNTTTGTQTGTVTSTPNDTLGFGGLLKGAAGDAQANDTNRNAFLTDVMQTGGTQFGSQVDQAVRNSLSGPQISGSGDSARARAAGYAGAQIGRNNLDQRLGAAKELAGPSSLSTLSTAANPYIGNTQSSNLSTDSVNNISNTLSGLVSNKGTSTTNEASTGSTAAGSSQAASGQVPEGQPVKSGGCVICTAGLELGLFRTPRALRRAALHKLEVETGKYRSALSGYFKVFTPLARWMLRHPKLSVIGMPIAKAVVYEELRIAGKKLPFRFWPWFHHTGWHATCVVLSKFTSQDHVSDEVILGVARKHNVCFNIKEVV